MLWGMIGNAGDGAEEAVIGEFIRALAGGIMSERISEISLLYREM